MENTVLLKILSSGKYFLNGSPERAGSRMFFLKQVALSTLWKGSKGLLLWHSFLNTYVTTDLNCLLKFPRSSSQNSTKLKLELEPWGILSSSATQ